MKMFTKSAMVVLTAAVIGVGLLFLNPSKLLPEQGSQIEETSDWGELEPFKMFVSFAIDDVTLESAIRNDYVQIVNKSAEKDGYKITVNAVIADENALILLYTAATTTDQEIYGVSSSKLTDAISGGNIGNGMNSVGSMGGHLDDNIYKWYGKKVVALDRSNPSPNQVIADFQIASVDPGKLDDPKRGTLLPDMRYSDRLKVNFTINSKFWEQKTETVVMNHPIILDGQEITLAEVEFSPLRIVARYTLSDEMIADWKLNQLILLKVPRKLLSVVGKDIVELNSYSSSGIDNDMKWFSIVTH